MLSALFAIIFTAAIFGIFKPYIARWKRSYFAGVALISLILSGVFAPKPDTKAASADNSNAAVETPAVGGHAPNELVVPPAEPESKWSYSEDKDKMRGDLTKYASVTSDNEVDLGFPYGSVNGNITVRHRPKDGLNIMFSVDKGQILCHNFGNDSYISAKFDDGPIKRYRCTGTSDGSSDTAFISDEGAFLANLRKAKRTIIEAEFYQNGNQQYTFQTADLKWN